MPLKERSSESAQFDPEKTLIALFTQASFRYPANMSGQGIWLLILFREWQDAGRIPHKLQIYILKHVLRSEVRDVVLQTLANAAQKAHKRLADKPTVTPNYLEGIMTQVLRTSGWCRVFERSHLNALLEMLSIYMQIGAYMPNLQGQGIQYPELTRRQAQIKEIAQSAFDGDFQRDVLESIDEVLFTRIPSLHDYLDARFGTFVMRLYMLDLRVRRLSQ